MLAGWLHIPTQVNGGVWKTDNIHPASANTPIAWLPVTDSAAVTCSSIGALHMDLANSKVIRTTVDVLWQSPRAFCCHHGLFLSISLSLSLSLSVSLSLPFVNRLYTLWQRVAAGCSMVSNYKMYASELNGVMLTLDGGATWTMTNFPAGIEGCISHSLFSRPYGTLSRILA
jgi:hypothetical protein